MQQKCEEKKDVHLSLLLFLSSLSFLISVGSEPEDALQSFQFPIDNIDWSGIDYAFAVITFSILSVTAITDV